MIPEERMKILLMRLKAPLMSFGDVDASEEFGPTMRHPGKSMIAGLIANALGLGHDRPEATQDLQDAIEIASLEKVPGRVVVDDQSAQLSRKDLAWTTSGRPMERGGHEHSYRGAVTRRKEYIAGAEYVVAVRADPALLERIATALRRPFRTLFIGRRCCLPTRPLFMALIEANSLVEALRQAGSGHARWPAGETDAPRPERELRVADLRDWNTRLHGGRRPVAEGVI